MAQAPFKPTDENRRQVDAMAAYGVPELDIARVLRISINTLRKYFSEELATAHIRANSAVVQSLYQKAIGNGPQSVTACIFWCKTRLRWKEPPAEYELAALGKKEQQAEAALRAGGTDTDWAGDLGTENIRPN